jgi:hypothetical protein
MSNYHTNKARPNHLKDWLFIYQVGALCQKQGDFGTVPHGVHPNGSGTPLIRV